MTVKMLLNILREPSNMKYQSSMFIYDCNLFEILDEHNIMYLNWQNAH